MCLKRLSLYDLFDNVWSCEDFGTTKSDPEIYRMAAERIGTVARGFFDDYEATLDGKEIKISNAIIKDSLNNDVTLNYNISYNGQELPKTRILKLQ